MPIMKPKEVKQCALGMLKCLTSAAGADSEGVEGEANKAEGSSPGQTAKPLEKPAEVIAFEAGKEIMDLLRGKHPHSTGALELMMSEIGERSCTHKEPQVNEIFACSSL